MNGRMKTDAPFPTAGSRPMIADAAFGSIDVWKLWSLVLRRWPVFVGSTIFALALAATWLLQTVPLYTATAEILLDQRRKNPLPGESLVEELQLLDYSAVETEIKLINSFAVATRTVDKLKLAGNGTFTQSHGQPGLWHELKHTLWSLVGGDGSAGSPAPLAANASKPAGPASAELDAIHAVLGGTSVNRIGSTYLINVAYTHADPAVAALVANGVAEAYLTEQFEAHFQTSKRSADWLGERTAALRQQLEASERAVAEHRAKYNLASPKSGSLSEQQATDVNAQLVAARGQTVEKKVLFEQASRLTGGNAKIESVAAVVQSPIIAALRQQEADIARQEADLLTRYGPEHPNVLKIRAESRDLRRQVSTEVGRVVANLKNDYEFALSKERSLETTLKELTGSEGRNDAPIIQLKELEREAEANKTLYETLLARFKEAEQQQSLQAAESRVVSPAVAPGGPSYPDKRRVLMVATVLGLTLGIGLTLLLEHLERGFSTVEQTEAFLQLPVLAAVPRLSVAECKIDQQALSVPEFILKKPLSRFGESIRSARVSAQMSDVDNVPKVLLVTSSVPSEGKTTIALSMAYSAALANQKVLLMDCDLRHPSTTKYFDLGEGPGLTDFLLDQKAAKHSFFRGPVPGMTLLPAGTTTLHPPDLLGSEKFKQLLAAMRKPYDVIIIDAPPVTPVIDSVLLSQVVDKVVLVVHWRSTPRDVVARTINSIHDGRNKIAGVILNNAELGQMSRYAGYYNYYNKTYDKYYA